MLPPYEAGTTVIVAVRSKCLASNHPNIAQDVPPLRAQLFRSQAGGVGTQMPSVLGESGVEMWAPDEEKPVDRLFWKPRQALAPNRFFFNELFSILFIFVCFRAGLTEGKINEKKTK